MKKEVLIVVVGIVFLVAGYILGSIVPVSNFSGTSLDSDLDTFAYSAGIAQSMGLVDYLEQNDLFEEFSEASFLAGVKSGMEKDESTMTVMDAQMNIQNFAMKRQQAMQEQSNEDAEKNLLEGMAFLEENKNRPEIQVTETGLQYEILTEGTGVIPLATDTVEVHYHGTLLDGTVFDSSVDRDETATFPVNGVIAGWTEALQMMKEGSKWKLYIPSDLAYGSRQRSAEIKGNSTLIFEVELIDVKNK